MNLLNWFVDGGNKLSIGTETWKLNGNGFLFAACSCGVKAILHVTGIAKKYIACQNFLHKEMETKPNDCLLKIRVTYQM